MDLVSVVIPAYNRGHTLNKSIQSVLDQKYENFEIIVVDDGSTDNSLHVLRELEKKDERIRAISHSRNLGAQSARKTGIENAHGEWIAFLDSDDVWLADSLALRMDEARRSNTAFVHSGGMVARTENGPLQALNVPRLAGIVHTELLKAPGPLFPTFLVKKEALIRIGGVDESIISYQEWDTAIRLSRCYPFGYVEESTFIYDRCGSDTISSSTLKDAIGYRQIVHKHFKDILIKAGPKTIAQHYVKIARRYKRADRKRTSFCFKLMSRFWWPRIKIDISHTN
jgi:glycosyltransferase involved in cell wall biosynthesis